MRIVIIFLIAVITMSTMAGCLEAKSPESPHGTGSLRVTILGPNGEPLAGAKVISNTQPPGQLKVTGSTGNDGTVTYNGLRAGQYEFYVSRFDYEQAGFNATVVAGRTTEAGISMTRTTPPSSQSPQS